MVVATYKTKKDLKAAVGKAFRGFDPSLFGGVNVCGTWKGAVVGPGAYERKFYAQVEIVDGIINKVK